MPEKDANAPASGPQRLAGARGRKDPRSDADRFHFRDFNLQKPLLAAEVKPESNALAPLELKD